MSNKQKLPKHITAHESLETSELSAAILKNNNTNLYFSTYIDDEQFLEFSIAKLNDGYGWPYNKDIVGKQIVF